MSDDEDFAQELRVMQARRAERSSSSAPNARNKRPRSCSPGGTSDTENGNPSTPFPPLLSTGNVLVSRNIATTVKNHAKKQKLRGDQLTQVDTFLAVRLSFYC